MGVVEETFSAIAAPVTRPRLGIVRNVQWWLFLAAVWAPMAAFLTAPLVLAFVPASRSPLVIGVWLVGALIIGRWLFKNFRLGGRSTPEPASAAERRAPTVVVIGAGPIGLAAVKELRAVGAKVECFERAEGVGGVYRFDPEREGGVWPGTRLTSSPWVTAFSDFPPRSSSSQHWLHHEYVEYLERYAHHFSLKKHLRFGWEVQEVRREGEGWLVRVRCTKNGAEVERRCDHVAICSGLNLAPRVPQLEGTERFEGRIQHVAGYKGSQPYRGERVVVVGGGESAVDVAHELATTAESVSLSMRRGAFVIPRVNPDSGEANDYDTNRLRYSTPTILRNAYMLLKRWVCAGSGRLDPRARLRLSLLRASGAGPMSQPATKSDDFLEDVLEGRVAVRPAVARLGRDEVEYIDGTTERADVLLLGTGYRPSFPFVRWGSVEPLHPGEMFLNMFVPAWGASVAFLGCARPTIGAIPPSGELQARYFAQLVSGAKALPLVGAMADEIAAAVEENRRTFPVAEQPNVLVQWIPYLDRLAALTGCQPPPRLLLREPRFAWKMMSGPMTGAMYRLEGPGAAPAVARDTISSLPRKHGLMELLTHAVLHLYAGALALVLRDRRLRTSNTFL